MSVFAKPLAVVEVEQRLLAIINATAGETLVFHVYGGGRGNGASIYRREWGEKTGGLLSLNFPTFYKAPTRSSNPIINFG